MHERAGIPGQPSIRVPRAVIEGEQGQAQAREWFQNTVKLRGREWVGLYVRARGGQQLRANRIQTILFGLAGHRRRAELHVLRHDEIVLGDE